MLTDQIHFFQTLKLLSTHIFIEGQLEGEGRNLLRDEHLALYDRGGEVMRFHALADSEFLVLGGLPLNEPLVGYGPFVMNSQDQINACIRNYRAGKMGHL